MRHCARCKQTLPLDAFSRNRSKPGGRDYWCKPCHAQAAATYQKANAGKVRDYQRTWRAANVDKVREQARVRSTQWRENNPERAREVLAESRARNREAINARARERYQANKDKERERGRLWHAANRRRDQDRANERRRENPAPFRVKQKQARARRLAAPRIPFTRAQLAEKIAYWGNHCAYCGGPYQAIDHVIALNRGGWHCLANIRPACFPCNGRKADHSLAVFL